VTSARPPRHAAARLPTPQTPSFWIDESGARGSAGKGYVLAGIKTRHPDRLLRQLQAVRERHGNYSGEFKWTTIGTNSFRRVAEMAEVLGESDAHLVATVVDHRWNPFSSGETWAAQAALIARLVVGGVNRNEIATVMMDGISTPVDVSLGQEVKRAVNTHFRGQVVVTAVSLDSKSNDLLQAADLIAGAIRYQRFQPHGLGANNDAKRKMVRRVAEAFGVEDLSDQRTRTVNIQTCDGPLLRGRGR